MPEDLDKAFSQSSPSTTGEHADPEVLCDRNAHGSQLVGLLQERQRSVEKAAWPCESVLGIVHRVQHLVTKRVIYQKAALPEDVIFEFRYEHIL